MHQGKLIPATSQLQEIVERDEAGSIRTTYILSINDDGSERLDFLPPPRTKSLPEQLLDVFLPTGYPHSVTEDYMYYQIYDSLQAFSSSIAGMFASRAVLEGVGVGDAHASPTAALLLSVIQESVGRIATILFAHRVGTALEPECKAFRFAADIFNDTAMVLDCLSPALPKTPRVLMLSLASALRALCGVAAGSSKASLSAHFAKQGNLAELNAKDSSQETVISLLGMLTGSFVISRVTSPSAVWISLLLLITIHLWTNYLAVRSVILPTLNRQRATLVLSTLLSTGRAPSPAAIASQERIFTRPATLRSPSGTPLGHCHVGVSLGAIFQRLPNTHPSIHGSSRTYPSSSPAAATPHTLLTLFAHSPYVLWFDVPRRTAYVAFKACCPPRDQVRAWFHALLVAHACAADGRADVLAALRQTGEELGRTFDGYEAALRAAGWEMAAGQLETRPRVRIAIGL